MQNIQKGSDSIASHFTNLRLLHQRLVEERGGILLGLLLLVTASLAILAVGLLFGGGSRHVKAHLNELVLAGSRLLSLAIRRRSVIAILRQRHLNSDFIATGQVGVANLGVRKLEGGAVLNVECNLSLGELGLSPVPSTEGVLLALKGCAVPVLEDLAQAIVVLLLEAVQLNDSGIALENADFVSLGSLTPLRVANVVVVECKCITASVWLPTETSLCKSAAAALLGEVEVDVVEALTIK